MAVIVSSSDLQRLEDRLLNKSGDVSLHKRFRVLFTLKNLKSKDAVDIIAKGFNDPSVLLKHELAYCLGQLKNTAALPILESVLRNKSQEAIVRHEAAEALGAISDSSSVPVLKEFLTDPERSVRETCEIAIAKIEWDNSVEGQKHISNTMTALYTTIDPAPPTSGLLSGTPKPNDTEAGIQNLHKDLINKDLSLFQRYRAMFALRNIGTPAAVDALAAGFSDDSALFRHEIAFVLGQLSSPHSVPALLKVLQNDNESDMVRHEAVDALGGIATPEVLPHLHEWLNKEDIPLLVRESCQVAIDMWEYTNSDEFQYADGLSSGVSPIAVV